MEFVAVGVFALAAAAVQAGLGVGYGIVLAPLAALVSDPDTAIATTIVTGSVAYIALYLEHRPRAPLRETGILALAGVAGIPFGVWLLAEAGDSLLRLLVGIVVLASALTSLFHGNLGRPPQPDRVGWMTGAGLISGAMRGAVGMPGPPVLLYTHWRGGSADLVRRTLFGFNGVLALPALALAALAGVLTPDAWELSAAAAPGVLAGLALGRAVRPRLSDRAFARASLALLAGAAALGIATAIVGLA